MSFVVVCFSATLPYFLKLKFMERQFEVGIELMWRSSIWLEFLPNLETSIGRYFRPFVQVYINRRGDRALSNYAGVLVTLSFVSKGCDRFCLIKSKSSGEIQL